MKGLDAMAAIRTFLKKLAPAQLLDFVDIAMSRRPAHFNENTDKITDDDTFRYFCGICWNQIKGGDQS